MTFRIDADTAAAPLERGTAVDAIEAAMGFADKGDISVSITDLADGVRYPLREFDQLMRKVLGLPLTKT